MIAFFRKLSVRQRVPGAAIGPIPSPRRLSPPCLPLGLEDGQSCVHDQFGPDCLEDRGVQRREQTAGGGRDPSAYVFSEESSCRFSATSPIAETTAVLEESEPGDEVGSRWSARYPDHRQALARFFATSAIQRKWLTPITTDEERIVNHLVTHLLKVLSMSH
jgi:hypothetical protein